MEEHFLKFEIYNESRLDDHIELVQEVLKDWEWKSWYPTKEQLKEVYSREGFTADTRHYLYDGDLLVGFLSTAMEGIEEGIQFGSIHRLFVRKGYVEHEDKIMEKALTLLKNRGAKAIRTSVKPGMGNYTEVLERWGFGERTTMDYSTIFQVEKYVTDNYSKPENLIDVNLITQKELFLDALILDDDRPREELAKRITHLIDTGRIFGAGIIKDEKKILAHTLLYTGNTPQRSFMFPIKINGKPSKKIIEDLFYFSVNKAHEAKKTQLYHQITNMDLEKFYDDLDLKFVPSYKYILRV